MTPDDGATLIMNGARTGYTDAARRVPCEWLAAGGSES
jgi:hypothetical protein